MIQRPNKLVHTSLLAYWLVINYFCQRTIGATTRQQKGKKDQTHKHFKTQMLKQNCLFFFPFAQLCCVEPCLLITTGGLCSLFDCVARFSSR